MRGHTIPGGFDSVRLRSHGPVYPGHSVINCNDYQFQYRKESSWIYSVLTLTRRGNPGGRPKTVPATGANAIWLLQQGYPIGGAISNRTEAVTRGCDVPGVRRILALRTPFHRTRLRGGSGRGCPAGRGCSSQPHLTTADAMAPTRLTAAKSAGTACSMRLNGLYPVRLDDL